MKVRIESGMEAGFKADLLAVPVEAFGKGRGKAGKLPAHLALLDKQTGGAISRVTALGDFAGREGETHLLHAGEGLKRVLLLGLGEKGLGNARRLRHAAGRAVNAARKRRAPEVAVLLPPGKRAHSAACAQALAEGAVLGNYRFDTYRSNTDTGKKGAGGGAGANKGVTRVTLLAEKGSARSAQGALKSAVQRGVVLAESQNLARQLSNEPPNLLPPVQLAKAAERVAKETGLKCRILDGAELKKLGMGAMLAVAQGSNHPPRLIVLEHGRPAGAGGGKQGGARRKKTICLIGKGVCFDSGGLSLKPPAAMTKMKHDMSGGATVIGALRAAALLNVPQHVVGIVGAVENMPSHTAYRVDDILHSASGKTIEVSNTDAEGRLVLADCLHYAQQKYKPAAIVDFATLTGACAIALGPWAAAAIANDDILRGFMVQAGENTDERYWPLPLWEEHLQHMRGDAADLKQTGGRDAGTITAAAFLAHFVETGLPWVHLDIASVANTAKQGPVQAPGATGFGVRSVIELLRIGKF